MGDTERTFEPAEVWSSWPQFGFIFLLGTGGLVVGAVHGKLLPQLTVGASAFLGYWLLAAGFMTIFGWYESRQGPRPVRDPGRIARGGLVVAGVVSCLVPAFIVLIGGAWVALPHHGKTLWQLTFAGFIAACLVSPAITVLFDDDMYRRDRPIVDRDGNFSLFLVSGPVWNAWYWIRFVRPTLLPSRA